MSYNAMRQMHSAILCRCHTFAVIPWNRRSISGSRLDGLLRSTSENTSRVRAIILTNAIFSGQWRCRRLRLRRCRRYRAVTLAPEDCLRGETKTRRYRVPRENRREAEVYVYMKRPACLFLAYTQVRKYIVTPP